MAGALPFIAAAATVGQAAMSYGQARQQQGGLRIQAGQARLAAEQQRMAATGEEVRGQAAALDVREQLLRTLATSNARYAAAGVSLASGSPETVAQDQRTIAERQLSTVDTQTRINASTRRLNAANSLMQASLLEDQADGMATAGAINAGLRLAQGASAMTNLLPGTTTAGAGSKDVIKSTVAKASTGRAAGPV